MPSWKVHNGAHTHHFPTPWTIIVRDYLYSHGQKKVYNWAQWKGKTKGLFRSRPLHLGFFLRALHHPTLTAMRFKGIREANRTNPSVGPWKSLRLGDAIIMTFDSITFLTKSANLISLRSSIFFSFFHNFSFGRCSSVSRFFSARSCLAANSLKDVGRGGVFDLSIELRWLEYRLKTLGGQESIMAKKTLVKGEPRLHADILFMIAAQSRKINTRSQSSLSWLDHYVVFLWQECT